MRTSYLLTALLLTLLWGGVSACKVPLDERQAVAELQKKSTILEEELQRLAGENQQLKDGLDDLRQRYEEVRDELLKQAEQLKAAAGRPVTPPGAATVAAEKKKVFAEPPPALTAAPAAAPALTPDEKLYQQSLDAYNNGDYEEAVRLFAAGLNRFPASVKAANARYWLGESYYSLAQYAQAISEFARVKKDFPDSPKVPDALLKTAMSYEAIGSLDAARRAHRELLEAFPGSHSATLAREALARLE